MGMIKKDIKAVPPVPRIPSVPETKQQVSSAKAIQPVEQSGRAGDDKMLTTAPVRSYNRDESISVDAIHKSSLESPTLANMITGKSEVEQFKLIEEFVKKQIMLNREIKRG